MKPRDAWNASLRLTRRTVCGILRMNPMEPRGEARKTMSITISLPPDTEEKLRKRAAECGQTVDSYLRDLVEHDARAVNGGPSAAPTTPRPATKPSAPHDEVLAPVREEFERSGMSEEE